MLTFMFMWPRVTNLMLPTSWHDGCICSHLKSHLTLFLNASQKNQDGKIIILYDNDETMAHRAATTLVERGYENLFMLSGGRQFMSV